MMECVDVVGQGWLDLARGIIGFLGVAAVVAASFWVSG